MCLQMNRQVIVLMLGVDRTVIKKTHFLSGEEKKNFFFNVNETSAKYLFKISR